MAELNPRRFQEVRAQPSRFWPRRKEGWGLRVLVSSAKEGNSDDPLLARRLGDDREALH